jgi:hypothetical protein
MVDGALQREPRLQGHGARPSRQGQREQLSVRES